MSSQTMTFMIAWHSKFSLTTDFYYTQQFFSQFPQVQFAIWNSCLNIFAEGDSSSDLIFLFCHLCVCDILGDKNGKIIHGVVEKLWFKWNLVWLNMILNFGGLCGEMGMAQLLFDNMPQGNIVSWNFIITQLLEFYNYTISENRRI